VALARARTDNHVRRRMLARMHHVIRKPRMLITLFVICFALVQSAPACRRSLALSTDQLLRKPVFWVSSHSLCPLLLYLNSTFVRMNVLTRVIRTPPSALMVVISLSLNCKVVFGLITQAYGFLMLSMGALIITFIALAADTANHCVWINGVCFDRPQGGYA
jgi:hypothetical protein